MFSSCEDDLNLAPHNSLTPDSFYKTLEDYKLANEGLYAGFFTSNYYGNNGILSRPDIVSDNVILAQKGRKSNQSFHEWRYSPNLSWNMLYGAYVVNGRANYMVDNINNLVAGPERDNYLGMAKASRALAMFDLLRVYSKIPTQSSDANASLGISINTDTNPNAQVTRSTVADSYAWVIDQLESAKTLISSTNDVDEMNLEAVNGILSRVYLYNGDYQKCIDAANEVTTPIASVSDFPNVWNDSSVEGVLFKINQDRVQDNISLGTDWSQSVSGNVIPEYVLSFELSNLYQANDVRKTSYSFLGTDSDGNTYNAIFKMFGETGQNNGVVDAKVIRSAEVYLNKAEAYFMNSDEANALIALDMVRQNRYTGFASGNETGSALIDAIKLERRLELFAEGHRFFDLKRWGNSVSRSTTDGEFSDGTGTPVPAAFTNMASGSYLFQFPIPQSERDVFPGLEQNPGY